jgi:tetratricopeptide (TPR) repeat protein
MLYSCSGTEKTGRTVTETQKIREALRQFTGIVQHIYKKDSTKLRRFYSFDEMTADSSIQDSVIQQCLLSDPDFLYTLIELSGNTVSDESDLINDRVIQSLNRPSQPFSQSLLYYFLSKKARQANRKIEAIRWMDSAIGQDSSIASYYQFKGKLEMELNRPENALAAFRNEARLRKLKSKAFQNIASYYFMKNDTIHFLECFEQAVADLIKEKSRLRTVFKPDEIRGRIHNINQEISLLYGLTGDFHISWGDTVQGKIDTQKAAIYNDSVQRNVIHNLSSFKDTCQPKQE